MKRQRNAKLFGREENLNFHLNLRLEKVSDEIHFVWDETSEGSQISRHVY